MVDAIYCRNGHFNGYMPNPNPSYDHVRVLNLWQEAKVKDELARLAFCTTCGAENIFECLNCKVTISSYEESAPKRPSYCGACGKPFPWTETAIATARDYTDEIDELSIEDKTTLKATFDDLIVYTPRTDLAVTRFKRILKKAGSSAGEVLTKIFVDVSSEAIVKMLKG